MIYLLYTYIGIALIYGIITTNKEIKKDLKSDNGALVRIKILCYSRSWFIRIYGYGLLGIVYLLMIVASSVFFPVLAISQIAESSKRRKRARL